MIKLQKYINSFLKIVVGCSPSVIILSTFSLASVAETTSIKSFNTSSNRNQTQIKSSVFAQLIQFPSAPDRGAPLRTGAGGRRGISCIHTNNTNDTNNQKLSLTALMPTWDNQGKTVTSNPNLYVYVPTTITKIGEFVVINNEGEEVYQTNFIPPKQPGIVKITIPDSASLEIGKKYDWYFTLICDSEDRSKDIYLSGVLERSKLGLLLNKYLQKATPLKKAEVYANNRIWYDTIRNVAAVRTENPDVWTALLQSVGLGDLATEPFVDFGTPKP